MTSPALEFKDTGNTCVLYKCPPEVREMIFELLCDEWTGKMSDIIKALRQDVTLYAEAMSVFLKMNHSFVLDDKTNWSFGDMEKQAILGVRRIKIIANMEDEMLLQWIYSHHSVPVVKYPWSTKVLEQTIPPAVNIREVCVECVPSTDVEDAWLFQIGFHEYLYGFEKLKKVNASFPASSWDPWDYICEDGSIKSALKAVNKCLGTLGKRSHEFMDTASDGRMQKWEWEAEDGKFLNKMTLETTWEL